MSPDVLVYSHHRGGGGTPLDSLWFSADTCAQKGLRLHFTWTGARWMGLGALVKARRVLFDGANSPKYYKGPIIWWLVKALKKPRAIYWHETSWIIDQARSSHTVREVLKDPCVAHFHVCSAGATELSEKYAVPKSRVHVLHNMSVAEGWNTYPVSAPVIPSLFVTVGPLQQWKAPDLFLQIARKTIEKRPESQFIWMGRCGAGQYSWSAWRSQAIEFGIADRMLFLGHVEKPLELMARSEAVILTSRSEGMPKVVIEALALGKKVVAFDVGGVAEALDGLGRVVPLGDVSAFCEALLDRSDVTDKDLCSRRRQRYVEHFTSAAFAVRFVEAIKWWDEIAYGK